MALAKAGLTTPGASALAGPGLAEVCETVGIPPILGLGACVDNSRILIAVTEMVRTGGLGDSIADLPVAGCAPEYMSEKAIAIGQYFVASGVHTVFGVTFPIVEDTKFHKHLFEELEERDNEDDPSLLRFLVDMRGEDLSSMTLRDDLMTM